MERPHPIRSLRNVFGGIISALRDPKVQTLLSLTVSVISIATVFYHYVEGWEWIDAAYFSTVTIATVGYGDFVPKTNLGKVFTIAYVMLGIGIFVSAAGALADHLIRRAREEEWKKRRSKRHGRPPS